MAASDQVKRDAQDKLTRWIDLDQRVVSYRELARELGLNINVAKNLMAQHLRENENLFPTYLMTGRYLPSIKFLNLTQTQSATQAATSTKQDAGDKMEVDATPEDDLDKTPTKARKSQDDDNAVKEDGWPLKEEQIVAKGMLLVGGREEMEAKRSLFVADTLHVQIHSLSAFRITDPGNYLASTVRLRAVPGYNDAETYGTITGGFDMAKAKTNGKPVKPSTTTKAAPAKATTSAFSKPAAVTKPTTTEAVKGKGKAKATKQDDDEPMLKPGKLSGRSSKRVIRSETPEEEEPAKPKQVAVQKPVAVSMPNNTSAKPVQDLDIGEEDRLAMEAMMDMSDNFDMPSSSAMVQPMDDEGRGFDVAVPRNNKRTSASRVAEQAGDVPEQRTAEGAKIGQEGKVLKKRRVTRKVEKKNKRGFAYFSDVSTDEEYWSDGTSAAPPTNKKAGGRASALKRNASTTSVSTKGDEDTDSPAEDSQASAAGKKTGVAKTKAGAAITSGTKSGGTGKTSATGAKPPPKKNAGQTSMFSYFKKQ
ncbi:hypothetical protein QFC20_002891 [Naganishia adeliensis]|uniref:Uncharacterized protein n=1 Tax=Naganishia adeliensis TaxID=92952 RepID=A0ACC2WHM7_9TREE|nr:hypothetical protein QFC20_002891 [Naganishia adeliensis]